MTDSDATGEAGNAGPLPYGSVRPGRPASAGEPQIAGPRPPGRPFAEPVRYPEPDGQVEPAGNEDASPSVEPSGEHPTTGNAALWSRPAPHSPASRRRPGRMVRRAGVAAAGPSAAVEAGSPDGAGVSGSGEAGPAVVEPVVVEPVVVEPVVVEPVVAEPVVASESPVAPTLDPGRGVFNWEEGPGAEGLAAATVASESARARSGRRRTPRPVPPPEDRVAEGDAVKVRGTPDWMARRIAESRVPGAAYELGKDRRWRRRKVTVLRSRANRRLVRRIDTWTVFKVSFVFYLLMLAIVLVAGTVSWNVAEHLGFVNDIQKSVRSLADDKKFVFRGRAALRYSAAGGAVLGLLGTLFNTVAAMLYNLLSDVIGGLQVIVVTEPE